MKSWVYLSFSLVAVFLLISGGFVKAEELRSDQYIISEPFLDMDPETSKSKSQDTYSLFINTSERELFAEKGFFVRKVDKSIDAAIDNAHIRPIATSILGERAASAELSVKYEKGRRAAISVGLVEQLKSLSGSLIDSTKCDRVTSPCSRSRAQSWKSPSALGWGYTVKGDSSPGDFLNGQYYRQFSHLKQNEQEELVVLKGADKDQSTNTLSIKVKKSANDRVETYQAIIRMTAQLLY